MPIIKTKYLAPFELKLLTDLKFIIAKDSRYENMRQKDGSEKENLITPVKLSNGEIKDWIPNETSKRKLVIAFGPDTLKWIGHGGEFDVVKQNVRGEIKDVIYLK